MDPPPLFLRWVCFFGPGSSERARERIGTVSDCPTSLSPFFEGALVPPSLFRGGMMKKKKRNGWPPITKSGVEEEEERQFQRR